VISERQGYVLAQLYQQFGWSATLIATTLQLKRRQVENAIRRSGVEITRRSKKRFRNAPVLTPEAAQTWFHHSALQEQPTLEPQQVNTGTTYVFRRRRCHACSRLTTYATHCPSCGSELDWTRPIRADQDITAILEDATRANEP
jgi:hypothetical protein